jgi:dTDP-glucose 4,6-dehydratase
LPEDSLATHEFVIRLAPETHVDKSIDGALAHVETNVPGTFKVLEASRKIRIETVKHVSTDEVR